MDGSGASAASGDDGVEEDGELASGGVGGVGGGIGSRTVVRKVVVVFNRLEGDGFAEKAEVVDWDGFGKEGLQRYSKER